MGSVPSRQGKGAASKRGTSRIAMHKNGGSRSHLPTLHAMDSSDLPNVDLPELWRRRQELVRVLADLMVRHARREAARHREGEASSASVGPNDHDDRATP